VAVSALSLGGVGDPRLEHILPDGWDRMKLEPAFALSSAPAASLLGIAAIQKDAHISVVLAAASHFLFRDIAGKQVSYRSWRQPDLSLGCWENSLLLRANVPYARRIRLLGSHSP